MVQASLTGPFLGLKVACLHGSGLAWQPGTLRCTPTTAAMPPPTAEGVNKKHILHVASHAEG